MRQWAEAAPYWCLAVCSKTLLTRPSTSGERDWEHVFIQIENILNAYCELLIRLKKSRTNKVQLTLSISNQMFLYAWVCDFQSVKVSQGKVGTLNRWGRKLNHLSIAYLLSNICTKNYWNRTTTVEIIVGGWLVYFFGTQSVYKAIETCMRTLWTK